VPFLRANFALLLWRQTFKHEAGALPQLVVAAASLWPTGGTVWKKAVRKSVLKKLLATMEHAVSDGLHRRTSGLDERVVWVDEPEDRWPTLVSLLSSLGPQAHVMVFVTAPAEADATANHLRANLPGDVVIDIAASPQVPSTTKAETIGPEAAVWRVGSFHAKRSREEQVQTLAQFDNDGAGTGCVLVCTDALARGIDMAKPVDVVVQLGPADNGSVHLHRVGRTARQGQPGVAVTIACRATEGDAAKVAAGQRAVLQEETAEEMAVVAAPTHSQNKDRQSTRASRAAGRALATKADRRRSRKARSRKSSGVNI